MYYLHLLSDGAQADWLKALNVFQYVTFRAVAAAMTAFLFSLVFGNWVIRRLISLKLGQPIRTKEEVHKLYELHGQKAGTPTMGGVLIIASVLFSTVLWAKPDNKAVWLLLFSFVYCGALGFWDDYLKITKKNSAGISERTKLIGQSILAAIVAVFFLTDPEIEVQSRALFVPFFKQPIIWNLGGFTAIFLPW
jgi:phospho-N-acetylmuramoyl-pentapeptide-transferase